MLKYAAELERHVLDDIVKPEPDPIFGRKKVDGGFQSIEEVIAAANHTVAVAEKAKKQGRGRGRDENAA